MFTKTLFSFAAMTAKTLCLAAAAAMALVLVSCAGVGCNFPSDESGKVSGYYGSDGKEYRLVGVSTAFQRFTTLPTDRHVAGGLLSFRLGDTYGGHSQSEIDSILSSAPANFSFDYDASGDLSSFTMGGLSFDVTSSPLSFVYEDDSIHCSYTDISTNSNGYITSYNYAYTNESESYNEEIPLTFTYSDNHLTQVMDIGKYTSPGTEGSVSLSMSLTWADDTLQQMAASWQTSVGESTYSGDYVYTFRYDDTSLSNVSRQWLPNQDAYMLNYYALAPTLLYAGFYGEGSACLPASLKWEYAYSDKEYWYWGHENFSYSCNDAGLVTQSTGDFHEYKQYDKARVFATSRPGIHSYGFSYAAADDSHAPSRSQAGDAGSH